MTPTERLTAEHRVIEQVLDCLEELARRCAETGHLDGEAAREALDLIRGFADTCHHGKEEAHLFRMLEEGGMPRQGGPTGVMLHEHEVGRGHVRAMAAAVDGASGGDAAACDEFSSRAGDFVALLRQHIAKEDECLFPMAERAIVGPRQEELNRLFSKVDREEIGEATHRGHLQSADRLAARLGVKGGRGAEYDRLLQAGAAAPGEAAS